MEEQRRPLIVMIMFPIQGRLIPFMTLASHLASLGATIDVLCPDSRISKLQEAKSRGFHSNIRLVSVHSSGTGSSTDSSGSPHDTRESARAAFGDLEILAKKFSEYLNSTEQRPRCLIVDEVCSGVAKVARKSGLPKYIFCPQRALALAMTLYAPSLDSQGKLPVKADGDDAVSIPGISEPVSPSEVLTVFTDVYPSVFMKFFLEAAALSREADGILLNTFDELEPEALEALRTRRELNPSLCPVFTIGPLVPVSPPQDSSGQDEESCIRFLDIQAERSVIVISFGSILKFDEQQASSISTALQACKKPFIWMLRDTPLPQEASLVQTGLVIRGWVPQVKILSHPSTGAFFSHCGWNSTLESISCGVPLVACPYYMDQQLNCKLVVDLGIGVKLHNVKDPNEVETALRHVLDSREMKMRAEHFRNAGKNAATADHLTSFLNLN